MTEGLYKLPEGWRWVRLGEVCQHRTGIWGPEASDPAKGFPIVRSTEIDGFLIRPQAASVRMVRPGQVDAYKLETGDILVNKSSGSPHLVGWPAVFEDPQDGRTYLFSNFMLRLRSDQRSLEPWFLLYYLHSPIARSIYLGAQDTTSGLRNLRVQEFMAQLIPLPPLDEQRRIVARIEELIERVREAKRLRQQVMEDAERLWQSALAETFPRPGTEPPPGWRWVRLGEVCNLYQPKTITVQEMKRNPGPYPVFGANGIIGNYYQFNHEESEVIVSCRGTCGTVNMSLPRSWITGNAMVATPAIEGLRKDYLYWAIKSTDLRKAIGGSAQPQITRLTLSPMIIPLPPLEEQRQIVSHLKAVQEKIKILKEIQATTDAELQRLEQAILDSAFRGEL